MLVVVAVGIAGVWAVAELALAGPWLSTAFDGSTLEVAGYGENTWTEMYVNISTVTAIVAPKGRKFTLLSAQLSPYNHLAIGARVTCTLAWTYALLALPQ